MIMVPTETQSTTLVCPHCQGTMQLVRHIDRRGLAPSCPKFGDKRGLAADIAEWALMMTPIRTPRAITMPRRITLAFQYMRQDPPRPSEIVPCPASSDED